MFLQFLLAGGLIPGAPVSNYIAVNNVRSSYVQGGVTKPGAQGDGVTDDTAAIIYWLSQGGFLWFPPGTYLVSSTLPFTLSGTQCFGSGFAVTKILCSSGFTTGDVFTMTSVFGCRLGAPGMEFTIDAQTPRTSGAAVSVAGGSTSLAGVTQSRHAIDVDMNNQFGGVKIGDAAGIGDWGTQIGSATRRAFWRNFSANGNALWFNTIGASQQVHNLLIINTNLATGPGAGIRYTTSGDVKFFGVDTYGQGGGVLIDSTSTPNTASLLQFSGCEFDQTSTAGTYDNFKVNLGGGYNGVLFVNMSNVWIASATGNGVNIPGPTGLHMEWSNGEALDNQAWGINGVSHMTLGANVLFYGNVSGTTTG